ncbi:DUF222 domain-containing protein [Lacisediminihabitans profunda]|uniref:DUF222 domain-containing protein n=1 Tax=Lacisediminihabitans profunda TaxID=2594790 RepID=A0A5C8UTL7_9MICO|nr:HNH endonuclease signature motif containing protein [Lacisediminihabitans profunda]TXN31944.1 DUF222 domain-containing protein [Lacisediminihabitans profunda]
METLTERLRNAAGDVALLGDAAADFAALSNAELLAAQGKITVLRACADRFAALAAGEIARRSHHDLGEAGLARAGGYSSTEQMIQSITGVSRQDAVKLIGVGTLIAQSEAAADEWSLPALLAAALESASISLDAVEAIRRGLGDINPAVGAEQIALACARLIETSSGKTPEQIYRNARSERDALDEDGIARREMERRDLRSVRAWWDAAGMYCGTWRLPAEEGVILASAFDDLLSPRRGGPRFVTEEGAARSTGVFADERTTEQVAADALVDMVRVAVDADPGTLFGRRRPAVRVIVTETQLRQRAGHGHIEGHPDPVSFATIERHLCDTGAISIGFDDDGQCVNVGRDKRLFTERQRTGMAVRDGGCLAEGCDRPPSHCEAHHIDQWARDGGKTNIADGTNC